VYGGVDHIFDLSGYYVYGDISCSLTVEQRRLNQLAIWSLLMGLKLSAHILTWRRPDNDANWSLSASRRLVGVANASSQLAVGSWSCQFWNFQNHLSTEAPRPPVGAQTPTGLLLFLFGCLNSNWVTVFVASASRSVRANHNSNWVRGMFRTADSDGNSSRRRLHYAPTNRHSSRRRRIGVASAYGRSH
jgi:hypothetical protein